MSNLINSFWFVEGDIPISNLIHYYKFDADADDSVTTKNGIENDVTYVSGKINNGTKIKSKKKPTFPIH